MPEALGRGGVDAVAVAVDSDDRAPCGERYVRGAVAGVLGGPSSPEPVVLVGHSGAGPLLGAVGTRLRAAGRPVGGYLSCDAGPPRGGASRLDLLALEDLEMAAAFRAELERGGRFPPWSDADLEPLVPVGAPAGPLSPTPIRWMAARRRLGLRLPLTHGRCALQRPAPGRGLRPAGPGPP